MDISWLRLIWRCNCVTFVMHHPQCHDCYNINHHWHHTFALWSYHIYHTALLNLTPISLVMNSIPKHLVSSRNSSSIQCRFSSCNELFGTLCRRSFEGRHVLAWTSVTWCEKSTILLFNTISSYLVNLVAGFEDKRQTCYTHNLSKERVGWMLSKSSKWRESCTDSAN